MALDSIQEQFNEALKVLQEFSSNKDNLRLIEKAGQALVDSFSKGGKVISCGNGGSMCDAMHFAEELTGRYREDRKPFPAISISDPSHISCVANDYGYDFIFSRFIEAHGTNHDILLAISTSGNSKNVILGIEEAKKKGMTVIGLTGKDGGKMRELCDIEIRAPHSNFADRAQEIHIKVIHSLIDYVEINS